MKEKEAIPHLAENAQSKQGMKIGILTLPVYYNYGGILQAFALQTYLTRRGHEVWLIDRRKKAPGRLLCCLVSAKRMVKKYLFRQMVGPVIYSHEREAAQPLRLIATHTMPFIARYLQPRTPVITREKEMKRLAKAGFDAFIVGSDQVWRPDYSPYLTDYFLGFLPGTFKGRRIAYAASFGVGQWLLGEKPTRRLAALLQRFDAVSVREASGIDLCKQYFGTAAVQVLDPTLLLTAADYLALMPVAGEPAAVLSTQSAASRRLWIYVLDLTADKRAVVDRLAAELDLEPVYLQSAVLKKGIVAAPVTDWLAGLRDADFVFTDSFHGTVFSILFHKPFLVYANRRRGTARFSSLLNMFSLQNRLIHDGGELTDGNYRSPIDWAAVDRQLDYKRDDARTFLSEALGESPASGRWGIR